MDFVRRQPASLAWRWTNRFWTALEVLESRPLAVLLLLALVVGGGAAWFSFGGDSPAAQEPATGPRYEASGALLLPENFRSWVFVGASTGLSYSGSGARRKGPGLFHNVYLHPAAYQDYARTGEFPEGAMLALAMYEPSQKDELVRGGFFEGDFVALEIALKDHERFEQGWAYFNFTHKGRLRDKATAIPGQTCFTCHAQHGAQDNVFVQFYPVLRRLQLQRARLNQKP